ncbi:hypothetical protein ABTD76_09120 [Acinetobacter baumannii]
MRNPEQCPECQNYFVVEEHQLSMPGTKEKELIKCPYEGCTYSREQISNGWFNTHKANPTQIN